MSRSIAAQFLLALLIVAICVIGLSQVSTYRRRILDKMDMKTNAELTHYAIRNGMVE